MFCLLIQHFRLVGSPQSCPGVILALYCAVMMREQYLHDRACSVCVGVCVDGVVSVALL